MKLDKDSPFFRRKHIDGGLQMRRFVASLVLLVLLASTSNAALHLDLPAWMGDPGEEVTLYVTSTQPCTYLFIDEVAVVPFNSFDIATITDFGFAGSFAAQYQPYLPGTIDSEQRLINEIHGVSSYPVASNSHIWFMTLKLDDDPSWVVPGGGYQIRISGIVVDSVYQDSLTVTWALVPEPATLFLLGFGGFLVLKKKTITL